jgi:ribonucleoside-diphosphate reductase beta chain
MKKHILRGEETYNLAPFEFEWAWTMAQHSLANHWTPQEVAMGRDKACYDLELSADEKWMFYHVFATLTTADLAIQENLTERVYGLIKAAEIKLYVARQIAEEGLHSASYQHVIEVLGLPQESVYDLYKRVPEIAQWFAWAKVQTTSNDILLPLIFYYAIFEGVFFPTAFAAIYSLQRRRLMIGTGEQIQYIHRDETMHVGFGIRLVKEIIKEQGAKPEQGEVHDMFKASMKRLEVWAKHCIPSVLGYSADLHMQHARFLADKRLKQLGYEPVFHAKEALPWLDEQASIKKEKNFFETRVTDYQSGGALSFDESETGIDSVLSWR